MRLDDEMTDADDKMDVNGSGEDTEMVDDEHSTENASCCLSVTNVPDAVFEDDGIKQELSQLFTAFDEEARVSFLKSFRRVRVAFRDADHASDAKLLLHGCTYRGCELGVYFIQTQPVPSGESSQLRPPPLTKQFLISPPSSPPVGWEQTHESHPVINYDLLQAMASLDKTEPYELHPPDINAPSIVVHLCDEDKEIDEQGGEVFHPLKSLPREVVQTRRPNAE